MNILFTNSAKSYGGNERWLTTTANELSEIGHNVYFAGRNDLLHSRLNKKIQIFTMPFKHEFDSKTNREILKIAEEKSIDILFPTKRKENYLLGRIGKKLGIPVVFRLGILWSISKWDLPQRFVYSAMCDKVIVNAQAIKDYLINDKVVAPEKVEVVYNGYNFSSEIEDFKIFLPEDKFVFASAGRLAAQKGYDLLLEAIKILKEKRKDFYFVIAGEGGAFPQYSKFIEEHNLQDYIRLIGNIDNVVGFFDKADTVIIPSRSEGIPNTLFEAWSRRKPVIAARSSGIPEAIAHGENGILFDLDPQSIAEAIEYTIDNKEKMGEFGLAGYDTLTQKFTMSKMLNRLVGIFEDVQKR